MDVPLRAHTFNEVRYYLMVTPCQACGQGPWEIASPAALPPTGRAVAVRAHCRKCHAEREFSFVIEHEAPASGVDAETINPTDAPSRIVDLGQWLSLFYLLVESGAREQVAPEARMAQFRATLCLAEALKFYADDELPPASAFFSAQSAASFRDHPEGFARQKLRDMQGRLPTLGLMARRLKKEVQSRRRRWWRFWRP